MKRAFDVEKDFSAFLNGFQLLKLSQTLECAFKFDITFVGNLT